MSTETNTGTERDARRYGALIDDFGFSQTHEQTLSWVPVGARVLELGCASGHIGQRLIAEKNCRVTGAELDPEAAREAESRGLCVRVGSLEDPRFRESLGTGYDVVIAADVLEHLAEPEKVLDQMRHWLGPGGRAIVAVPNIAVWSMRIALLRGHFEYTESGLLDRTHLRFFTWNTFHAFVTSSGWRIEDTMVERWELPGAEALGFEWPLRFRKRFAGHEVPKRGLSNRVVHWAFHKAGRLVMLHGRASRRVGARFPNLCATHIALVMSPPAQTP